MKRPFPPPMSPDVEAREWARATVSLAQVATRQPPILCRVMQREFQQLEKSMAPHQQRVVDEKTELDDKLSKLVAFFDTDIFAALSDAEKERMSRQANVMQAYSNILFERIAAFPA